MNLQSEWDQATTIVDDEWESATPISEEEWGAAEPEKKGFLARTGENLSAAYTEATTPIYGEGGMTETLPKIAYKMAGTMAPIVRTGLDAIMTVAKHALGAVTSDLTKETLSDVGEYLGGTDFVQRQKRTLRDFKGVWDRISQAYPAETKFVEDVAETSMVYPMAQAGRIVAPIARRAAVAGGREAVNIVRDVAEIAGKKSPEIISKEVGQVIQRGVEKGIRPSVAGKRSYSQAKQYYDRASDAVKNIVSNRENLVLTDAEGNIVKGRLPSSLKQFGEAIEQTKKSIFRQYDDMAKSAGDQGAIVKLDSVTGELDDLIKDPVLQDINPGVAKYVAEKAEAFAQRGAYTTEQAQDAIASLNKSLEAFYKNPSYETASRAGVDSLIVNNLRKSLDAVIENTTGEGYQALKRSYGSLKAIEKDVMHRSIVDARKNIHGLLDFTDIFTSGELLAGLATMNPSMVLRAGAWKGVKEFFKHMNNPNRIVKSMFGDVEMLLNRGKGGGFRSATMQKFGPKPPPKNPLAGDASGVRPTPLGLPMPERGFAMKGESYGDDIINAKFTSRDRPLLPGGAGKGQAILPPGQGFKMSTRAEAGEVIAGTRGGFDLVGGPYGPDVIDVPFTSREIPGLPPGPPEPPRIGYQGFEMKPKPPETVRRPGYTAVEEPEGVPVAKKKTGLKWSETPEPAGLTRSESVYKAMGDELGLKFKGVQRPGKGNGKNAKGYVEFHDPVTGSDIGLQEGENLFENLKKSREKWEAESPTFKAKQGAAEKKALNAERANFIQTQVERESGKIRLKGEQVDMIKLVKNAEKEWIRVQSGRPNPKTPVRETAAKEPWTMTREDLKAKYPSIPQEIVDRLGTITVDPLNAGEGNFVPGKGLNIKGNDKALLHEIGHAVDNILTPEQAAQWEGISTSELKNGILGNKPDKLMTDSHSVWENLYSAFSIYHRSLSGEKLLPSEVASLKKYPKVYQFVKDNLSEGKSPAPPGASKTAKGKSDVPSVQTVTEPSAIRETVTAKNKPLWSPRKEGESFMDMNKRQYAERAVSKPPAPLEEAKSGGSLTDDLFENVIAKGVRDMHQVMKKSKID